MLAAQRDERGHHLAPIVGKLREVFRDRARLALHVARAYFEVVAFAGAVTTRLITRPGRASVVCSPSYTTAPFTHTVRMPVLTKCGSVGVARSITVCRIEEHEIRVAAHADLVRGP